MDLAVNQVSGESQKVFGPLNFENDSKLKAENQNETKCFVCEDSFNLNIGMERFLGHIFDVHNLVVEDVQNIDYLSEYVAYWRNKFSRTPMEQIIPSVKLGAAENRYYLLSTLLKEDKELRHRLKLKHVLQIQETERTDTSYVKPCLFCRLNYEGTKQGFLEHLSSQHNLQLGNPQNLVFIDDLVQNIEAKLNNLKCIYCEKTFPERNILKEHMRKKLHKRINPQNTDYDRFYIVNYLEPDKNWQVIQKEDDRYAISRGSEANTDDEYSDWNEEEDTINCLFCKHKESNINTLCMHMGADHGFDFSELTKNFDFYQKVKLVNYIRREIHNLRCSFCNANFESIWLLEDHMRIEKHYKIPENKTFDQPEYYFPTYENDAFLYFIDDVED